MSYSRLYIHEKYFFIYVGNLIRNYYLDLFDTPTLCIGKTIRLSASYGKRQHNRFIEIIKYSTRNLFI